MNLLFAFLPIGLPHRRNRNVDRIVAIHLHSTAIPTGRTHGLRFHAGFIALMPPPKKEMLYFNLNMVESMR
uniref:Secreted protein n=1 Tax=Steinernema glaseri TaxID=37863 RepID=A0A1I7ZDI1_9BILA